MTRATQVSAVKMSSFILEHDYWFISHRTFSKIVFRTQTCDLVLVLEE